MTDITPVPGEEEIIDLDALRITRAERNPNFKTPKIRLRGVLYELPPTLSAEFLLILGDVEAGNGGAMRPALQELLGDSAKEMVAKMEAIEMLILMREIPLKYGLDPGEFSGSAPS